MQELFLILEKTIYSSVSNVVLGVSGQDYVSDRLYIKRYSRPNMEGNKLTQLQGLTDGV